MSRFQLHIALFLAFVCEFNLATEESIGRWTTCRSQPPRDAFLAPNNEIPTWSRKYKRYGRALPNVQCKNYFARHHEKTEGSGKFMILRNYDLDATGKSYKLVKILDYLYGYKNCVPVQYDTNVQRYPCYIPNAQVWKKRRSRLGFCSRDGSRFRAWVSSDGDDYEQETGYLLNHGKIICLETTKRREVVIMSVGAIVDNVQPDSVLEDKTINNAKTSHKWSWSTKWTETLSSKYSSEHGWRVSVSTTISTGPIAAAVANWETTVETETSGTYTVESGVERSTDITYQRDFVVPPKTEFSVSMTIYKADLTVKYKAKERLYDDQDHLITERDLDGVWTGVASLRGDTIIKTKPVS